MNVCVFCGSSLGGNPIFRDAAHDLGAALAGAGVTLVYGGGNIGLMGVLADAAMRHGGEVIGVIPDFLMRREVGHGGISRLEVVDSMHSRKRRMAELSDAFVAMPGGWGTLDELAEILTWNQLQLIVKPVFILNSDNFFDHLLAQMRKMVDDGFLSAQNYSLIKTVHNSADLLKRL
ncbi:MAG TPA: TIGR00730 family Rossman fold protein [Cyclobacteriaceae bacterium]|nr:TIGR00730 family Rossman fold protein [Cyclobacteriaceae bacterium]